MSKFRKKPAEVEAVQVSPGWLDNPVSWLQSLVDQGLVFSNPKTYKIAQGDSEWLILDKAWVLRTDDGFRVIGDYEFRATYEPVED